MFIIFNLWPVTFQADRGGYMATLSACAMSSTLPVTSSSPEQDDGDYWSLYTSLMIKLVRHKSALTH